tara:strand:- start:1631 stop:1792 length:162 start_codon:yes stop_codon:yes gene_type:complete
MVWVQLRELTPALLISTSIRSTDDLALSTDAFTESRDCTSIGTTSSLSLSDAA